MVSYYFLKISTETKDEDSDSTQRISAVTSCHGERELASNQGDSTTGEKPIEPEIIPQCQIVSEMLKVS